jgi:cyclophilin family peptidyl-prolyl cis-trans isomerase/protein-disulfide isomerase
VPSRDRAGTPEGCLLTQSTRQPVRCENASSEGCVPSAQHTGTDRGIPADAAKVRRWGVALAIALSLASCQPAAPPTPSTGAPRRTAPALGPTSTATQGDQIPSNPATPTASLIPVPTPSKRDWQRGPSDATVTIVSYMDFQCTPCNAAAGAIAATYERHPDQVRQVYRPFPLSKVEDKADLAAIVAEAAGRQGAFWSMHDILVSRFSDWRDLDPDAFAEWASNQAEAIGLDRQAFETSLDDPGVAEHVQELYAEAQASGIPGAPFVLLNGRPFLLAGDEVQLEAAVRLAILQPLQKSDYPQVDIKPASTYVATLHTNRGTIELQLYADTAPLAVNSFVHLAKAGWYSGSGAYQVVPGQWIGLGDPTWTGLGDVGYLYPSETDTTRHFDRAGMVGIIPAGPGINGSRFFVGLVALPEYDETHTVLGRVIEGMDLLNALTERDPLVDLLAPPELTIRSIEVDIR